ncbi:hypothetical protein TNCV_3644281 [Trichonephila clavipes]|nr:hypothetical protein TNCV_3644281 [Trichonephila clavipes]
MLWKTCGHFTLLQMASNGRSGHRMMHNRLDLLFCDSRCGCAVHRCYVHNPPGITGSGAKRMNEQRYSKNIFRAMPIGNRPRGILPLRWIDCVEKDLNILKVKNWKTVAKSSDA